MVEQMKASGIEQGAGQSARLKHASSGSARLTVQSVSGYSASGAEELLAVEEPLAIQMIYGPAENRKLKDLAVTMRTPGADLELVAGFLLTEGIVRDVTDLAGMMETGPGATVRVELGTDVEVNASSLERNFYTTSSCGICGKASLLALRSVCPPRRHNEIAVEAAVLYRLPSMLRAAQRIFDQTGGLHAAGLFDAAGGLIGVREDVGRHNAVDKLLGAEFLADRVPLRDRVLLLSGRASFELLQKAAMSGISLVASVGAPSSLAVQVARELDIALVGFLREDHFNIYHGAEHVAGLSGVSESY